MKRYIQSAKEVFAYDAKLANKPWSPAEQKRTDDLNKKLFGMIHYNGEWNEFYEEESLSKIESYTVKSKFGAEKGRETEICIFKNCLVYADNWDENARRVKRGAKVPGTIYYDVTDDGDVTDENILGYATLNDARHAAMIYMKNRCIVDNNIDSATIIQLRQMIDAPAAYMKRSPQERAKIQKISKSANKGIAMEMLNALDDDRLVQLDKALSRVEALTSTYGFSSATIRVYKEGWYLTLQGTRSDFSVWAYDNDGDIVVGRKPPESKLNFLYETSLSFNMVGEDFWYNLTEGVR